MTLEYSGRTSAYEHKHGDAWKETPGAGREAISTIKLIEAQWTNMPVEVETAVVAAWHYLEYGNDIYYWKTSLESIRDLGKEGRCVDRDFNGKQWIETPNDLGYLIQWLEEQGVEENEKLLIHWWW